MSKKPVVLVILDGFGISFEKKGNAIAAAKTPNFKYISSNYPGTLLAASGIEVGLNWGEQGNTEVGHINIGAGLVVYQPLARINMAIQDGSFFEMQAWKDTIKHATDNKSNIHLMGIVSNGGVHSHIDHVLAILQAIFKLRFNSKKFFNGKVFIHMFTDGRDTGPQVALKFLPPLNAEMKRLGMGEIATVMGRYYPMDKNENWDRVMRGYDAMVQGEGLTARSAEEAIANAYAKEFNDENLPPTVIVDKNGAPVGRIKDGDALIFFNFRPDRARSISHAFLAPEFDKFKRKKVNNLYFVVLADYGLHYKMPIAFPAQHIVKPLPKVISEAGKKQFHISEAEKYAPVTYFLSGGVEEPFKGEDRVIVPSKTITSYEEKPDMSAYEVNERLMFEVRSQKYDFLVANFANADMVGHTGNFESGIKSVEVLDDCIGSLMRATMDVGGTLVITADHGNVEEMLNLETGAIDREHSTNPVPLWIISPTNAEASNNGRKIQKMPQGILADVAPTILSLMVIKQPKEMVGRSLADTDSACPLC